MHANSNGRQEAEGMDISTVQSVPRTVIPYLGDLPVSVCLSSVF